MKTCKRWFALCLALLTVLSAMTVTVSAKDTAEQKARFIMEDYSLYAIDLSGLIEDLSTVNTGALYLKIGPEWDAWTYAEFDPEQPGVVRLGERNNDEGAFNETPWYIHYSIVETFTLSAEEGDLFDGVASYSFTTQDVYDSMTGDLTAELPCCWEFAVGEKDGDVVKTMTIRFFREDEETLLDTVDTDKEIRLIAHIPGADVEFRAVPVSYADGILTVALYDGDKAGVPLHGAVFMIDGKTIYADDLYAFTFIVPEGLFKGGDSILSEQDIYWVPESDIMNLPTYRFMDLRVPAWLYRLSEKLPGGRIGQMLVGLLEKLARPVVLFMIPRAVRTLKKSYDAYGLDFRAKLREVLLDSSAWKEAIRELFDF